MSAETKTCQNCKNQFTIEPEDFDFYKKIDVPPPTWCPQCRLIRRLAWRNERALYRRPCDMCQKSMIAAYSPDKPFKVYCPDCFYSDKWDPLSYGREYDFSKPFFVQLQELQQAIPHISLIQRTMINSPWCNYEADAKNCYLNFGGQFNEDGAYSQYALKTKDAFDTYWFQRGELAYETTLSEDSYRIFFSKLCYECRDTYFSFDCRNCSNIFGCSGLRNKQYQIYNQPVSKEEFEKFISENINGSYDRIEELKKKVLENWRSRPQRAAFVDRSVNSRGNLINASKNCESCWLADKTEDSKNILFTIEVKDSYDTTSVWGGELLYEFMAGAEKLSNNKFSTGILEGCTDLEYAYFLANAHSCFGCFNIRKNDYCILNKKYTKDEYENLVSQIKKHMEAVPYTDRAGKIYKYGEFLPIDMSPFGYNETVAYEYFPIEEQEAVGKGLDWGKYQSESQPFSDYVIPDNISEVGDDIGDKVLKCEVSRKGYRIIPSELAFYRRFNLPIPRIAPFERHRQRLRFIADHLTLHPRTCGKCDKAIDSVYKAEEFPMVYCEQCYQAEVV